MFASELFSVVNFLDDSEQAFNYLFLVDSNDSNYAIYTKDQFYYQVHHSVKQVSTKWGVKRAITDVPGAAKYESQVLYTNTNIIYSWKILGWQKLM